MRKGQFGKGPAEVRFFPQRIRIAESAADDKRNMADALYCQRVHFFRQFRTGNLFSLQVQQNYIGMLRDYGQQPLCFFFQHLLPFCFRRLLRHLFFLNADDFQFAKRLQAFYIFIHGCRQIFFFQFAYAGNGNFHRCSPLNFLNHKSNSCSGNETCIATFCCKQLTI